VTLGVQDLPRARKFYAEGLGLPLRPESSEEVAFFGLRGVWLALFSLTALAADAKVPSEGSGFRAVTLAHNVRTKAEVDALLAQAKRAGARIVGRLVFWGG
jgi:catechol 2,3-dioxygenase-like lactoylglutathione lyase family enzyme